MGPLKSRRVSSRGQHPPIIFKLMVVIGYRNTVLIWPNISDERRRLVTVKERPHRKRPYDHEIEN